MIATDERFWQSPPQNSSCVSLSPEPCSNSCWSNDSCEQTATCPASNKYSRHNSFTPIEDTVLITLPLSCRVEKRGRTVRRSGKSVYRSMLMDATAADLPSLRQGEGSAWACAPLYAGLSAWSAQSNPMSPAHRHDRLSASGLFTSPAIGRCRNPRHRPPPLGRPHRRSHRPIPHANGAPGPGDPGSTLFP